MKPGSPSSYEQPKKLSKGYSFSQTKPSPKLKGMVGFSSYGRVGGKVVPGGSKT